MRITFLGTGGGRYVTYRQVRRTGGIWVEGRLNVLIDPGPGSVRAMREVEKNPEKLDVILASHAHIDHVTDLPVTIEGMTLGGRRKRGVVIGPKSVISGDEEFVGLSKYHRGLPKRVIEVKPGDMVEFDEIKIHVSPTVHTEPFGVGYRVEMGGVSLSYLGDTGYEPGASRVHRGTDILILNLEVGRDLDNMFTSPSVARRYIEEIEPKLVLLTHFGMAVTVKRLDEKIARELKEETGVEVRAMKDLETVEYGTLFA